MQEVRNECSCEKPKKGQRWKKEKWERVRTVLRKPEGKARKTKIT